jgi:hypothetical protein
MGSFYNTYLQSVHYSAKIGGDLKKLKSSNRRPYVLVNGETDISARAVHYVPGVPGTRVVEKYGGSVATDRT